MIRLHMLCFALIVPHDWHQNALYHLFFSFHCSSTKLLLIVSYENGIGPYRPFGFRYPNALNNFS